MKKKSAPMFLRMVLCFFHNLSLVRPNAQNCKVQDCLHKKWEWIFNEWPAEGREHRLYWYNQAVWCYYRTKANCDNRTFKQNIYFHSRAVFTIAMPWLCVFGRNQCFKHCYREDINKKVTRKYLGTMLINNVFLEEVSASSMTTLTRRCHKTNPKQ